MLINIKIRTVHLFKMTHIHLYKITHLPGKANRCPMLQYYPNNNKIGLFFFQTVKEAKLYAMLL